MNRFFLVLLLLTAGRYVSAQTTEPRLVLSTSGHQAPIKDLAVTNDKHYLISAGYDKVIRIWDLKTYSLIEEIRGQEGDGSVGKIFTIALSPDNRWLAVGGWLSQEHSGSIRLYDFPNRRLVKVLTGNTNVTNGLAFSNDSQHLVSGSADNTVRVWRLPSRPDEPINDKPIRTFSEHTNLVYGVAMHGSSIVSASYDKTIKLWNLSQEKSVATSQLHTERTDCIAFSPNGKMIASGGNDNKLIIYNDRLTMTQVIDNGTSPNMVSFSSDGTRIVCGSYGKSDDPCNLYQYIDEKWQIETAWKQHDNAVMAVTFIDNQTIATAGGDDNEIHIWNRQNQLVHKFIGQGKIKWAVGFAGTNWGFTSAWSATLGLSVLKYRFDWKTRQLAALTESEAKRYRLPVLSQDGLSLSRIKGGFYGYDDATLLIKQGNKSTASVTLDETNGLGHSSYTIVESNKIISGGSNGALFAYDASGKSLSRFVGHIGTVWGVATSEDRKWLLSCGGDQVIKLWPLADVGSKTGIEPLVSLFVGADNEWVLWHPSGYYDASPGGEKYIGWHVNRGNDQRADYYPVANFRKKFYQPQFITRLLETGNVDEATKTLSAGQMEDISRVRPPTVQWQSPASRFTTVSSATVRVSAVVGSSSPVQLVKFLVNGRTGFESRGLKIGQVSGTVMSETITLQPGDNTIEVLVRNADAEVTSDKRVISYQPTEQDIAKPTLYVLTVGVSKYVDKELDLNYAHQDALDLARLLQKQQGGLYKEVVIKTLTNTEATQRNIKVALANLKKQATQRDLVVVLMAGHGVNTVENTFYFLPHDVEPEQVEATGLKYSDVTDVLGSLPCKVMMFLDACHAAGLAKANTKRRDLTPNLTEFIRELTSEAVGVVVMCASQPKESSVESDDWRNGAFTEAVLEGMGGKADYDRNSVVTLNELNLYVTDRVKSLTKGDQHTGIYNLNALSSFPLVLTGR